MKFLGRILSTLVFALAAHAQPTTLWTCGYGSTERSQAFNAFDMTYAGEFVGAGYSYFADADKMLIVKISSSGDTLWGTRFGRGWDDYAFAVETVPDGRILAAGYTKTGTSVRDMRAVMVSADGDSLWSEVYTGPTDGSCLAILTSARSAEAMRLPGL